MMISWSKCRPLNRSCVEVGSVIPAVIAGYRAFQQFAPEPSIPKGNANPWRKVWEKLMQWDEFIGNENRVGRCGQTLLAMRKRTRPMRIRTIRRFITMKTLLILLISFAFICTAKATDIDDLIITGLPVKVLSSGKSYKVFEQYPWEGHSSNYGPKGNRLNSSYGVGVGKNIFRSLQLRYGDWIHMPDIGWRRINESSSKRDSVEFFATYRDEYKSKYPRITIDMVAFALPSNQEPSPASEF
jgi:hypothetical protein